jgi:DNA adenine methylase
MIDSEFDKITLNDNNTLRALDLNKTKIEKPFLKWVGGKTQILKEVISKFPSEIENYHELFLGGGSVLLAILSLQKLNKIKVKNKIYAYDINIALINVYKNIQKNKDELFKFIDLHIKEYDNIKGTVINRNPVTKEDAKTSKESYYYWIRKKYNEMDKNTIECSALFMFLNKTCFRGIYREGPNGFNVPFGHYKKTPTIITKLEIDTISDLIKDVEFKAENFSKSIKYVKAGDFVYLDPPYAPESNKSFVGYVADGFTIEMHKELFTQIKRLNEVNQLQEVKKKDKSEKIRFVMSNSNVELVRDTFKYYELSVVKARRAINSKNPESITTEVIIHN